MENKSETARRKTRKIRGKTRLKNEKFAQSKDKRRDGEGREKEGGANCTGAEVLLSALILKTRCSRHSHFCSCNIRKNKGAERDARSLVIFFPFRYVMHSFVISCISAGKIFSCIFPPAEFFRCYPSGLYSVLCSIPFILLFFVTIIVNRMRFRPDERTSTRRATF